jgi:hypothetical protein
MIPPIRSIFARLRRRRWANSHWAAAEQSLLKSIALFEPQIAAAEKSHDEVHSEFSRNYRGSQSRSYALLAVVYFREGLVQDALNVVEKAYDEVTKYNLASQYRNEVVNIGQSIANASGDSAVEKVWSERASAK